MLTLLSTEAVMVTYIRVDEQWEQVDIRNELARVLYIHIYIYVYVLYVLIYVFGCFLHHEKCVESSIRPNWTN